jgi:hypothetical protein
MNESDISKILDELTNKLSGPASQAFGYAVRYQTIEGSIFAFLGALGFLIAAAVIIVLWRRDWSDPDFAHGTIIVFGAASIVSMLFTMGTGFITLTNPEWSALKDLLGK